MEVCTSARKPVYTGKPTGQTVYYEGGRVRAAIGRTSDFARLYGGYTAARKSLEPTRSDPLAKDTPKSPLTNGNSPISHAETPATAPLPGLDLSHIPQRGESSTGSPQTAPVSPFPELIIEAPPDFYIGTRASLPASLSPQQSPKQTFSVMLTPELKSLRLELNPVKPGVPDRIPARKVYQRLINRTKPQSALGGRMRKATDPIITPHYVQLSPTLGTYSYKAGCCIEEWERKAHSGRKRLI